MPTEPRKPLIVISYAHADEPEHPAEGGVKWLSFVTGYLRPAIKSGAVELWLDRLMPGGADWEREISDKLRACDIFILLVSRHSLSSDYVVDKEIAIIRERQANGEEVHFYPLVLTPTPKIALDLVRDKNLRPRDGKPFSDFSVNERYRHMNEVANEISTLAAKIEPHRNPEPVLARSPDRPPAAKSPQPEASDQINSIVASIKDRQSLEAWLRMQPRETAVAIAARATLRVAPVVGPSLRGLGELTRATFRAAAFARAASRSPARANELRAIAIDIGNAALAASTEGSAAGVAADAAASAAHAVAALDAVRVATTAADAAADAAAFAAIEVAPGRAIDPSNFETGRAAAAAALWAEVRTDAVAVARDGADALVDGRLWSMGRPDWSENHWAALRAALPEGQNWDVWVEWYEERLRGVWRGEEYDIVFASVPQEEWDKGPATANAWIKAHLTSQHPDIKDVASFAAWVGSQSRETGTAIAVRAALRVAPLAARVARKGLGIQQQRELASVTAAVFRALASARVSVQDPERISISFARNAAGAASDSSMVGIVAADLARAAMLATRAAANSAAAAAASNPDAAGPAAAAVGSFVEAFAAADLSPSDADAAAWNEIRSDAATTQQDGLRALLETPIWSHREPRWVRPAIDSLREALPSDEDWDVWIGWYEQRLRGGSRGEDYELVFARVPQEEWEKGPAAANAWIKAHLPKAPEATRPAELPQPIAGVEAPFTFGWTASQRIAIVAGAQNLPDYRHFSSEEDHRHALEACRIGGERLLKALGDGRYNARPEYGEALEYYLDDLPKTAGGGNILLANDQVRILHAMFLADAATLSEGFAGRLKSVIANQFALNAFYDLVQRHNEAVSAGNWTQPFPLDAAKGFFDGSKTTRRAGSRMRSSRGSTRSKRPSRLLPQRPSRRQPSLSSRRRCRPGRPTRVARGSDRWRRRRTPCGRLSCKGVTCR
jgi:hypothetical protein